ncbi:MAG: hypothetical protein Q9187_004597, partial [Circinaria calcarea]
IYLCLRTNEPTNNLPRLSLQKKEVGQLISTQSHLPETEAKHAEIRQSLRGIMVFFSKGGSYAG